MKYRDHRGGLAESLETIIEIKSVEQLRKHLNKFYNQFNKEVEEIKFDYIGMDARIGWDTYYVLQRLKGDKGFTVSGMSDGKL